ncbi:MAG: hypothetical protein FJX75_02820 [Armatimonadetes bacterium]|nr:hypothetical protein [Armatimonadota bacterium]
MRTAAAIGLLGLAWGAATQPVPPVVDDFEAGVGGWTVNDGLAPKLGKATLPQVYSISPGAPETKGKRAALIEFAAGESTWASVTKSVSGAAWVDHGCTGLALWLRGDGSRRSVSLVLRSYLKFGETVTDTSYAKEIALTTPGWTKLHTPFPAFKDKQGQPIDEAHLRAVKLLQFVKTGTWEPLRFTVDDVEAETVAPPQPPAVPAEALLVDFSGLDRLSRLRQGVCLGSGWAAVLHDEAFAAKVKGALAACGRPMVRVKLSDFFLPGNLGLRSGELHQTLGWIRSAGGDPLLCLDAPLTAKGVTPEAGWRNFGAFCAEIAARRRSEPGARIYEIGCEPVESGQFRTVEAATEAYNALAAQVLLVDPAAEVGGMGFASPWDEYLRYFIANARTLKFVSFHFYGAHTPVATDEDLFEAACRAEARDLPHQLTPRQVRELLDARPGARPELWITECALSSARESNGDARDPRIRSHFAAAWTTALSLAVAADVDRVLWFKAYGNGWGLLNDDGTSMPAMQALSLLSRALPVGCGIGSPTNFGKPLFILASETKDARYVIIANAAKSSALNLHLSGTPPVQPTRLRRLDPTVTSPTFIPLAPASIEKLTLSGPGVAMLEAPTAR